MWVDIYNAYIRSMGKDPVTVWTNFDTNIDYGINETKTEDRDVAAVDNTPCLIKVAAVAPPAQDGRPTALVASLAQYNQPLTQWPKQPRWPL